MWGEGLPATRTRGGLEGCDLGTDGSDAQKRWLALCSDPEKLRGQPQTAFHWLPLRPPPPP